MLPLYLNALPWQGATHFKTSTLNEVSSQLHAVVAFSPRKKPQYQMDMKVCGPHSLSGHGDERNPFPCLSSSSISQ